MKTKMRAVGSSGAVRLTVGAGLLLVWVSWAQAAVVEGADQKAVKVPPAGLAQNLNGTARRRRESPPATTPAPAVATPSAAGGGQRAAGR